MAICQKSKVMKTIINENQRGLLFKNGRFIKLLTPGKYHSLFHKKIEVLSIHQQINSSYATIDILLQNRDIHSLTTQINIHDQQLALHFVNEQFTDILPTGQYAFWNIYDKHTFQIIDTCDCFVHENIPQYIFQKIPQHYFIKIEVKDYEKAILIINNQFSQLLDSGTYYFWNTQSNIEYHIIDTRITQMNIVGQEILTQDKVSLRINFVCYYKVIDFIKLFLEFNDFKEQIRITTQLIMREFIGQYRLDDILENKSAISKKIFYKLKEKAKEYYIEIFDAGIKDIILPGEIRDIMNTVLIAQKKAQANVITRREEVASTRSLLNTAKLMDENKTLYKLKELEYLENICLNVGEINVNGNQQLLQQLTKIINGHDD